MFWFVGSEKKIGVSEEKSRERLDAVLFSFLIHRVDPPEGGSPVVKFYRKRDHFFHFLQRRCRMCRRLPDVLYYDSPRYGFLCDDCHLGAMQKRMQAVRDEVAMRQPPVFPGGVVSAIKHKQERGGVDERRGLTHGFFMPKVWSFRIRLP